MSEKVYSPGDEIDSYCTTCKIILGHRVVALVDDKVDKVICSTCNKKHKYRPNLPKSRQKKAAAAKGGTTTKKRVVRRRTKDPAIIWEETLAGRDMSNPLPYAFSAEFKENELLDHKKFGCGLVMQLLGEGKMEVMFKEGTKILIYGRK